MIFNRFLDTFYPDDVLTISALQFLYRWEIDHPVSGDAIAHYLDVFGEPERLIDEP